ncbi:MAG TPA: dihydrofolate reductase family protein [Solirubrobacteraceae bacterium]|nr:dihydrofolate reductase family protein [Solirubrobacteraceae bacterium]
MSSVRCHIAISLDGYAAGPDQSMEDPLGDGGERLHTWMFEPAGDADVRARERVLEGIGSSVMGRNMFGPPGGGDWDESWRGWWGEDPPYHAPVFVLTNHPREPLEMEGATTFHFVTDGIESALEQARAAAGDQDVAIAGGASTVQQYLAAGLLDEMHLHIAPIILGGGERLLENVGDPKLEPVEATCTPAATHIIYRVAR